MVGILLINRVLRLVATIVASENKPSFSFCILTPCFGRRDVEDGYTTRLWVCVASRDDKMASITAIPSASMSRYKISGHHDFVC